MEQILDESKWEILRVLTEPHGRVSQCLYLDLLKQGREGGENGEMLEKAKEKIRKGEIL